MKEIVIIGAGNHGRVLFSLIINLNKFKILGFYDDKIKIGTTIETYNKYKYRVLGKISDIKKIKSKFSAIIGIGDNYQRNNVYKKLNKYQNIKWAKIISNNSVVYNEKSIGEGSVILNNVNIGIGGKIGKHCIVNNNSSLDHDCKVGDFTSIAPGVIIAGNVTIGNMCHIGIGAIIKNNLKIYDNTIVGSSSFVNSNCKKNSVYIGVPAKFVKSR